MERTAPRLRELLERPLELAIDSRTKGGARPPPSRRRSVGFRPWPIPVALTLLLIWGCDASNPGEPTGATCAAASEPSEFPPNFVFGTAIAGFQVDMGCPIVAAAQCEDRNSDWYQFITTPRLKDNPLLFQSKEPPSHGPGFYELYEADLDRAATQLSSSALRLSIEWSRIFPKPTFGVDGYAALGAVANADGMAFYHRLFAAMKARGLKPYVTVNHYSLPLWIHDGNACNENFDDCIHRGWADGDVIVPEIAKYAGFIAREFGNEVDVWATLNEPFSAVVLPSYLTPSPGRSNPPGVLLRVQTAKRAMLAMIEAHARMYDAIKANDTVDADGDGVAATVGLVHSVVAVEPATTDAADARAAADADYVMNGMFLDGIARGRVDPKWDREQTYRADLDHRLDFLGVNYYARMKVQANLFSFPLLDFISPLLTFNMLNMQSDTRYPKGIYDAVNRAREYHLPMIITETGIDQASAPSDGAYWIVNTLAWLQKAMDEGADVRGYFVWSLMDNYEWNHGTAMKFGLYAVDPNDPLKPRVPRDSAVVFGQVAAGRAVSGALRDRYGAPPRVAGPFGTAEVGTGKDP